MEEHACLIWDGAEIRLMRRNSRQQDMVFRKDRPSL